MTIEEVASGEWGNAGKAPHTGDIVACAPLPGSRAHHGVPAADDSADRRRGGNADSPSGLQGAVVWGPVALGHTFAVARQPRERSLTDLDMNRQDGGVIHLLGRVLQNVRREQRVDQEAAW